MLSSARTAFASPSSLPSSSASLASRAVKPPRANILSNNTVSSQSKWSANSGGPQSSTKSRAFSKLLGNPSNSTLLPGKLLIRRLINAVTVALETSSPRSMISFTSRPNGVFASTSSRNISPHERWIIPHSFTSRSHKAPLPLPGPPTTNTIRAGDCPNILSAALRKQFNRNFPSLETLISSNRVSRVDSSGRSPTDSRSNLMRLRFRYGPSESTRLSVLAN
mmetsp:Transcript_2160/g.3140  ORF Transcript_2160/g.3140 Transcript_2160/m.3140 type:complete len:222 (-) Transcript_2160:517-1182(-)